MKDEIYKQIFAPDNRTLLQIMVFEANPDEWQQLLNHFDANYSVAYTEDGLPNQLPDSETIFLHSDQKSVTLEVTLSGFTVNAHFFSRDEIEMNVLPEDVDSAEKADAVFQFMTGMAGILNKPVFLTPEFGSATSEQLRDLALCVADPGRASVRYLVEDKLSRDRERRDFAAIIPARSRHQIKQPMLSPNPCSTRPSGQTMMGTMLP